MLSKNDIELLYKKSGISKEGIAYIERVRKSPPSRRCKSNGKNVVVRYACKKMGFVIELESHTVELEYVWQLINDEDVLEIYAQPHAIKLKYRTAKERIIGVLHTTDFLVIKKSGIFLVECKSEEKLNDLAISQPTRYQYQDRQWRCPPGEKATTPLGITYQLWSSSEINPILSANMKYLSDYIGINKDNFKPSMISRVMKMFKNRPYRYLSELLNNKSINPDIINKLICDGDLYVDQTKTLLSDPELTRVYKDQRSAIAHEKLLDSKSQFCLPISGEEKLVSGTKIHWRNKEWNISDTNNECIYLSDSENELVEVPVSIAEKLLVNNEMNVIPTITSISVEKNEIIETASPDDLKTALDRYKTIKPYIEDNARSTSNTPRTARRWLSLFYKAKHLYGNGMLGLIPKTRNRGNRELRLPQETHDEMNKFISEHVETYKQSRISNMHIKFEELCKKNGLESPSLNTFSKAVRNRFSFEKTVKTKGKRAAYIHEPKATQSGFSTHTSKIVRPFEECHIDHTQLDIEIISDKNKINLGRPWLTVMIDTYSRRIVGSVITFDSPSYRSCMLVMRDCVRRYHRLPDTIVVDNGNEFHSVYFEAFLAMYVVHKKSRPPAKPRSGAISERVNETINTQLLYNLQGNTQITKNVRQVTKSNNPKNLAIWTFTEFHDVFEEYAYDVYDKNIHSTLNCSPRQMYEVGIEKTGLREHKIIPYDDLFIINTLPTTPRGIAKIRPNTGVKINYIYYWSESFRHPEVEGTKVPIKYDPFDISVAYAYVKNRWVKCLSDYSSRLSHYTEKERQLATAAIKGENQSGKKNVPINSRRIAEFLNKIFETESVLSEKKESVSKANIPSIKPDDVDSIKIDKSPDQTPMAIGKRLIDHGQTFEVYDD